MIKIIISAITITVLVVLAIKDRTKIVNKNTPYGWAKIIDDDGDGIADMTLQPLGRGYLRTKPTAEEQNYFSNH